MNHVFYKYQGTGNDFIIIDNRLQLFDKNNAKMIASLCDRRFGIGADGLILLEDHEELDFEMVYFNSDGHPSSMCGNGGRCIVAFAQFLGIIENSTSFMAIDGLHRANINSEGLVELQMQDVLEIKKFKDHCFLDTGSPHHVQMIDHIDDINVKKVGAAIRYGDLYDDSGSNVNFVEQTQDGFRVRTYERGVEDETYSCGTGVTAVALAMHHLGKNKQNMATLITQGGPLKVVYDVEGNSYGNIWLIGPAIQVFKGEVKC
jgi:diaminopimelate epimerase